MADFPLEFLLQVKNEMSAGLSQATSQLKTLGSEAASSAGKVKQSGIGIGAGIALITTQVVQTVNSIISLKRQYEDLTRAQNNVTQSGFSLANAKGKLSTATINLKNAQQGAAGASKQEIEIAKLQFASDMKNAKSKLDVLKAHQALDKVLGKGGKDTDKIAKATVAYQRALRGVQSQTINNKEAQVNLQRAIEDFYLQTIPTAIGIMGSFASVFQVVQKSGIGLLGTLGKLAIPFAAIAGVALAIKTNFLGFRDFLTNLGRDIGNAVPALKPFLSVLQEVGELLGLLPAKKGTKAGGGLNKAIADLKNQFGPLMDTFKNLVDMIMKGNWAGAFNVIKSAAQKFWTELKKQVPIFGEIESFINKIGAGNWKGAFLQIWKAASDVWASIKKAVPFFGGVELLVNDIKKGDWKGAFDIIAEAAKTVSNTLFGENMTTRLQVMAETAKAQFNLLAKDLTAPGGAIAMIQDGLTKLGKGDIAGGFSGIVTGIKTALTQATAAFDAWVLTNFGINIPGINAAANALGKQFLTQFAAALTTLSKTFIDPVVKALLTPETWIAGMTANVKSIDAIGKGIWTFIVGAITTSASDPKSNAIAFAKLALSIMNSIGSWFEANLPTAAAQMKKMISAFAKSITDLGPSILLIGKTIATSIIKGITDTFSLESVGKIAQSIINGLSKAVSSAAKAIGQIGVRIGNYIGKAIRETVMSVLNSLPFIPGSALDNARKQAQGHASGFHGLVTGPTMFMAGERGAEQVDVTTRADMMTQRKPSGGGGPTTIIVYSVLDGRVVAESVARQISVNQAVYR